MALRIEVVSEVLPRGFDALRRQADAEGICNVGMLVDRWRVGDLGRLRLVHSLDAGGDLRLKRDLGRRHRVARVDDLRRRRLIRAFVPVLHQLRQF